jgi:hypothetical protein
MSPLLDASEVNKSGVNKGHNEMPQSTAAKLAGGLLVALFAFFFILPWWNRYLGLTNEGWYQFFGQQILQGHIPYRDFYMFVPPGQALLMAGITRFFGDRLVVPELFGFAGGVVLVCVIYLWLVRIFPVLCASVASVCTAAIYFRRSTESLSGLHLNASLFTVLALAAASFGISVQPRFACILLAGLFAGCAFLIKQTAGIAITASLGLMMPALLASRLNPRVARRALGSFGIGWSIPVLATCAWLSLHGALVDFVGDVFLHGRSSKGSLASLLTRQLAGVLDDRYKLISAAFAVMIVLVTILLLNSNDATDARNTFVERYNRFLPILVFCIFAIGLTVYAQHQTGAWLARFHRLDFFLETVPNYLGEFGSLALVTVYAARWFRSGLDLSDEQILLASGTSLLCAFLFSFSWPTAKTMLVPGFPFVAAWALSTLTRRRRVSLPVMAFAVVSVFVCIAIMASSKMRAPYSWDDWREGDALKATVSLDFPQLRGIRVTPDTAAFVTRVVGDIGRYSAPNARIAEFPTMPILYSLSNRAPATFAYIHYIDVTPDEIYRRDVYTLNVAVPSLIAFFSRADAEIREGELIFRNGHPSGERELQNALGNLAENYRLVDKLRAPVTGQIFEIWARAPGR